MVGDAATSLSPTTPPVHILLPCTSAMPRMALRTTPSTPPPLAAPAYATVLPRTHCPVAACRHAPGPAVHRVLVFHMSWFPLVLAEAGCWVLGGCWRSVRQVEGGTLGFFPVFYVFALVTMEVEIAVGAEAAATLVSDAALLHPLPHGPVGRANGALPYARAEA
jgi:hypothetical protein